MLYRRRKAGTIELVVPCVYRFGSTPRSWEQDAMAATLWFSDGAAAVSGPAAARLHSIDGFDVADVEISITGGRRPQGLPFRCRRVDEHVVPHLASIQGIPVTSVPRTLVDLAGIKDRRTERALDQVLRQGKTSLPDLWLLYEKEWMRGRRGVRIMKTLLLDRSPLDGPSPTVLERLLRTLITEYHLPRPRYEHPVTVSGGLKRLDAAYLDHLVAIECDSYAFHMDRAAFEADRRRDIGLQLQGWQVLRFTWARLRWDRAAVADEIRTALQRRVGAD